MAGASSELLTTPIPLLLTQLCPTFQISFTFHSSHFKLLPFIATKQTYMYTTERELVLRSGYILEDMNNSREIDKFILRIPKES